MFLINTILETILWHVETFKLRKYTLNYNCINFSYIHN